MTGSSSAQNSDYKVGSVLSKYDLEDLRNDLPDLWVGESGEALSLRDLAEKVNLAIVERALERSGGAPLEGEAANTYRLLTDDDVSAGVRTQQRNRLQRKGVDVDALADDFVTHQAVYTYLTEGRGVSKEKSEQTDMIEKRKENIQRLRSRLIAVANQSLSEVQDSEVEDFTLGEFDVRASLQVYCRECDKQYDLIALLDRGGCDCDQ